MRSGFELLSAHYGQLKGLDSTWTDSYRDWVNDNSTHGVEGGDGNYGPNSGRFDALGFGTLLYRLYWFKLSKAVFQGCHGLHLTNVPEYTWARFS